MDYESLFQTVTADQRYQRNLDWGAARKGHPEGTIRAHIEELERNLESLRPKLSDSDGWKLKVLIHIHDVFKADAEPGVPILNPNSHSSLAKAFLASYSDDADLLAMVQFHDEPFALWRQVASRGVCNQQRLTALLNQIQDWNLFLAFNIIDGCTQGKSREPLRWWFQELDGKVTSSFTAADILV